MKITRTLSRRTDSAGRAEIFLRLTVDRYRQYRLRTGIFTSCAFWLDSGTHGQCVEEAESLAALEKQIFRICETTPAELLSAQYLRQRLRLKGKTSHGASMTRYMERFIAERELSVSRRRQYATLGRMLADYESWIGRSLSPAEFDAARLAGFISFLRAGGKRGHNTICSIIVRLRAYLRRLGADVSGAHWKRSELYGTPYFLDSRELEKVAVADIGDKRLARLRDVFVFQCLTGCRVSDLQRLTTANIVGGAVEYVPVKTRHEHADVVRVPLHPTALDIVSRYAPVSDGSRLLPCVSPAAYNRAIRAVLKLCGVTRTVSVLDPVALAERQHRLCDVASSHLARRTFVGNLYRIVRDPALVSSMSGHKDGSKAFARYRRIDDDIKRKLLMQTFCRHGARQRSS